MKELLDLAMEQANELLNTRGYIFEYEARGILIDLIIEDSERFLEELRNGNVTFVDGFKE